jgi:hypothetical protein
MHHCFLPLVYPSMAGATPAEPYQAAADCEAAQAARVITDHDATTAATTTATAAAADAHAATVIETAHLVAEVDKLEADAARARQEATRARAALVTASPSNESAHMPPPPPHDGNVFWVYITAKANTVVAVLHTQVVSVLNINVMIPVYLHNLSPDYNRWKTLFLNTLSKYELSDHVLIDVNTITADDSHWRQMDCTIRSWL